MPGVRVHSSIICFQDIWVWFLEFLFCNMMEAPIGLIIQNFFRNLQTSWKNLETSIVASLLVITSRNQCRISNQEVFCRKAVLENIVKLTQKYLCRTFFSNKATSFWKILANYKYKKEAKISVLTNRLICFVYCFDNLLDNYKNSCKMMH